MRSKKLSGSSRLAPRRSIGAPTLRPRLTARWTALSVIIAPPRALGLARPPPLLQPPASVAAPDRRALLALLPAIGLAPATAAPPPPLDLGGGTDLRVPVPPRERDAPFPPSLEGPWACERTVVSTDGDRFQAERAWRCLGGTGRLGAGRTERYGVRFVSSEAGEGAVVDRGYEMATRTGSSDVVWDAGRPDRLGYGGTRLTVVTRRVENPSDKGFGSDELVRIDDGVTVRAAQVKRRFRRAFDAEGNRVVEGLEIIKTFRVLDQVAGTELPTSTTKSTLRLVRS